MIAVLQRVTAGRVEVDGITVGEIGRGYVVLLGVGHSDGDIEVQYLARRVQELRVFEDEQGRMNLSILDVDGAVLAVPQFTLLAGLRKGRRPDFLSAAEPEAARARFDQFVSCLRQRGVSVQTGRFGATMQVSLVNSGPATFVLDTAQLLDAPRSARPDLPGRD